jgi:hypothetical protein
MAGSKSSQPLVSGAVVSGSDASAQDDKHHNGDPTQLLAAPGTQFVLNQSGIVQLKSGSVFMRADGATALQTGVGKVYAKKGGIAAIDATPGSMRVKACSGPNEISVVTTNKYHLPLHLASEVLVTDHRPSKGEALPDDGIGRRQMKAIAVDDKTTAIMGEFSIASMINSHPHLASIKHPLTQSSQQVRDRLLMHAAIIQQLHGSHGRYYTKPANTSNLPDGLFQGGAANGISLLKQERLPNVAWGH